MGASDLSGRDSRSVQQSLFGDEPAAPAADASVFAACRIDRIRPPVKAHGGKFYLAPHIIPILVSVRAKVTEYLEPWAFGASVFLAMPRMQREILGDINPDVVALWTVLSKRDSAADLTRRLSVVPYTEEAFQAAKRETGVTQIERATRFLIRCRFSRGGLGKDFAWSERLRGGRPGDENAWHTFRENELPKIIDRAEGVEVLSDPCWRTVWQSRNAIQRLIYADPPYMPKTRTAKTAYGPFEMTPYQHARLITALRSHGGPAAISGYRCEEYDRWTWRDQSVTSFMGRHFVALACTYESLNPDGSVFHRGTTFRSGFVVDFHGKWYWVGAGHCLKELDERIERRELRVIIGSYVDYLGYKAKHIHGYPYTYAPGDGLYLYRPEWGFDFALIPLDGLMQASFESNNVVPIGRENWVHQHRLDFMFYRMLGIPQCSVRDEQTGETGLVLALLAIEDMQEAVDDDHRGMLTGRIHPDADIETIEGMSGGPIYGFRYDKQGGLRYHVVAVQSSWIAQQRVVFACPFAIFAERSHQFLLEHGLPTDRANAS